MIGRRSSARAEPRYACFPQNAAEMIWRRKAFCTNGLRRFYGRGRYAHYAFLCIADRPTMFGMERCFDTLVPLRACGTYINLFRIFSTLEWGGEGNVRNILHCRKSDLVRELRWRKIARARLAGC
jgi:hypothetical protein